MNKFVEKHLKVSFQYKMLKEAAVSNSCFFI